MKSYYGFHIASWLARFIPARIGYWLCRLIGGLIFYFAPPIRHSVMDNMRHVRPDASPHLHRNLARRVIRNTVKVYYDLVRLPHLSKDDVERMVGHLEGLEHLDAALQRGKGVILFSGHIGNFNIVAQIAAIRGYTVAIVAEDIKPARLYNYINRLRGQFGLNFIATGSSQVRTIYKLLRNNGALVLAADRDVSDTGQPVRFFDAIADLPFGPVVLSMRLNAPLVPVHAVRLRDNTSHVIVYPPMELERTGDYERDVQTNMRRLVDVLESMIAKAPDQWVVLQRVWDHEYTGLEVPSQDAAPGEHRETIAHHPQSLIPNP